MEYGTQRRFDGASATSMPLTFIFFIIFFKEK